MAGEGSSLTCVGALVHALDVGVIQLAGRLRHGHGVRVVQAAEQRGVLAAARLDFVFPVPEEEQAEDE